jgi:hypothetical protein
MRILKLDRRHYLNKHAGHTHQLRWGFGDRNMREVKKIETYLTETYRPPVWIKQLVDEGDWWMGWERLDKRGDYIISLPNEKLLTICLMII